MVDLDVRSGVPQRRAAALGRAFAQGVGAWPLAGRVAAVYLVSRLVSTAFFLGVGARGSGAAGSGPTDLLSLLLRWDSGWYQRIAFEGYPPVVPAIDGVVQPNAWAFLPVYPFAVKAIALGSPALWPLAAVLLSAGCGMVAALLLARLIRRHSTDRHALTAVVLFSFGPTAYILQTAYAEAMGLMLLFLLLLLVDGRRYVAAAAVAVPLAFTRPGMQAVALFVGLHLVVRVVAARRGRAPLSKADAVRILALGALTSVLGFVWPVIAGLATGRPDAYLATEIAWRIAFTGSAELGAFTPWAVAFDSWFGSSGSLLLAALLLVGVAVLTSRHVRALGSTVPLFAAAWLVYLLAVFFPQSSTFRLLMPLAPVGGAVAARTRAGLALVALICVLLQAFWLFHAYGAPGTAWSAP